MNIFDGKFQRTYRALGSIVDGPGIDFRWCHWEFFHGSPDRTMCPEVDSASESEYQGFLLGYRRPVCLADDPYHTFSA